MRNELIKHGFIANGSFSVLNVIYEQPFCVYNNVSLLNTVGGGIAISVLIVSYRMQELQDIVLSDIMYKSALPGTIQAGW